MGRRAASTGIYFTGGGDDIQQWARVSFQLGIRTVPAGSLQFVDFSKPDPGAERVERFMTAAKHALAEGDFKLAARRLVYARDAEPGNTAGPAADDAGLLAGGRLRGRRPAAVRDWIRAERDRPAPYRYAARIYEDMGALSQAVDAAEREVGRRAGRRVGLGAARPAAPAHVRPRGRARRRSSARASSGPTEQGLLDLALVAQPAGDVGAEVTACEQATQLAPDSPAAWARYAHALARTDRADGLPGGVRARARAGRRPRGPRPARAGRPAAAPRELAAAAASGPRATVRGPMRLIVARCAVEYSGRLSARACPRRCGW